MLGWKKLSITRKFSLIMGLMAILIAGEVAALAFSMRVLSAVPTLVECEGDWSKAQKNAIFDILHYTLTHDKTDYQEFLSEFKIPEGDHIARVELMKSHPDLEKVRQGFIQGHIHPEDIDSMISLLRHFSWVSYLNRAIRYWVQGDQLLEELRKTGEEYRLFFMQRPPDRERLQEMAAHIRAINGQFTGIEKNFSQALEEGSRWLEHAVFSLLLISIITVETICLTLTFRTSRHISRGLADNQTGTVLSLSNQALERRVQERTFELSRVASEHSHLYEKTKDALDSRDEFLSIASHELKTPLSGMHLQLQLMQRLLPSLPPSEATEKYKTLIDSSIRQMEMLNGLVEELLGLTRIRSGKIELKKETSDLKSILDKSLVQLAPEIARSKSSLNVQSAPSVVGFVDPLRIGQIMTNLISNAIKYGNGKPIDVFLCTNSDQGEFQVKDQGLGIPKDKQETIFDRFERASPGSQISGLGLGLYITRQLVEAHGGSISVESQVGQGSTFTVRLPLS